MAWPTCVLPSKAASLRACKFPLLLKWLARPSAAFLVAARWTCAVVPTSIESSCTSTPCLWSPSVTSSLTAQPCPRSVESLRVGQVHSDVATTPSFLVAADLPALDRGLSWTRSGVSSSCSHTAVPSCGGGVSRPPPATPSVGCLSAATRLCARHLSGFHVTLCLSHMCLLSCLLPEPCRARARARARPHPPPKAPTPRVSQLWLPQPLLQARRQRYFWWGQVWPLRPCTLPWFVHINDHGFGSLEQGSGSGGTWFKGENEKLLHGFNS
jgi:hypothetical protein